MRQPHRLIGSFLKNCSTHSRPIQHFARCTLLSPTWWPWWTLLTIVDCNYMEMTTMIYCQLIPAWLIMTEHCWNMGFVGRPTISHKLTQDRQSLDGRLVLPLWFPLRYICCNPGELNCTDSSSALNNSWVSPWVTLKTFSWGPEGPCCFKAALDKLSAMYVCLPFLYTIVNLNG